MAQSNDYDVILMDLQMPGTDGFEATRRIREAERRAGPGRRVPIVAITANATAADRQRCSDLSMDGFLTKPITQKELYAVLRRWLSEGHGKTAHPTEREVSPQQAGTPS